MQQRLQRQEDEATRSAAHAELDDRPRIARKAGAEPGGDARGNCHQRRGTKVEPRDRHRGQAAADEDIGDKGRRSAKRQRGGGESLR